MLSTKARIVSSLFFVGTLIGTSLAAVSQDASDNFTIEDYPEAKEAFEYGMNAVKLRAWDEAIDSFLKASANVHNNPIIFFNLGLALEKSQQPLLAATCFQAYLALLPKADNAVDVRNEITGLEKASAAKLAAIFKSLETNAGALPVKEDAKGTAYAHIANIYAMSGQMDDALSAATRASQAGYPLNLRTDLWITYAEALLDAGNSEKAQVVIDMVERKSPIPRNYKPDPILGENLGDAVRETRINSVLEKLKIARENTLNSQDEALRKIDAILVEYEMFRAWQANPAPSYLYLEWDLAGAVSAALAPLKKSEVRTLPHVFISDTNVARLKGPEYLVVSSLGDIARAYASQILKYQYIKEQFLK
jgi:tetratricopeptide (TPR) repeat protein